MSREPHALPRSGWLRQVAAFARLVRARNATVAAAYTLLGAYLAGGVAAISSTRVVRSALVSMLVVAFGNAVNDLCDVEVDRIAQPERPLPSGRISTHGALLVCLVLASAGIVTASSLSAPLLAGAIFTLALGAAYSLWLKGTVLVGHAAVALLTAALLPYGGLAAGRITSAIWLGSLLTLLYVFAQEILFSVEDEEADRAAGVRSTASQVGQRTALVLHRVFALLFCAIAVGATAIMNLSASYLYLVVLCTAIPTTLTVLMLRGQPSWSRVRKAVLLSRVAWYTGLLPIAVLRQ